MTERYLVDNNALISLGRDRVASPFFRAHCQVTTDVLREAQEHTHYTQLRASAYPRTSAVLQQIRNVMTGVAVGDTSLVDLYGNKGSADPGLVASALDAMASEEGVLFSDEWMVVTNDSGVEEAAGRHGVATIRVAELATLIDSNN